LVDQLVWSRSDVPLMWTRGEGEEETGETGEEFDLLKS